MNKQKKYLGAFAIVLGIFCACQVAAEADDLIIKIKDHRFEPLELIIPAKQKLKILVLNEDATAEEFESYDLNREKLIKGNSRATLFIGPLRPGIYKYFGDFNPKSAQGSLVVKES